MDNLWITLWISRNIKEKVTKRKNYMKYYIYNKQKTHIHTREKKSLDNNKKFLNNALTG